MASLDHKYNYDELKEFHLIASPTTGTDHIENRNIPLISLKGETDFLQNIHATAEMTMALILALIRCIPAAFDDVKRGNWNREAWQGCELRGKTLGIVGYGRVGQQVARIAEAFGMKVIASDLPSDRHDAPYKNHKVEFCTLDTLLRYADIITVHVPLDESTRGMFGAEQFATMKSTAYFINTSRGAVVDEKALLDVLFGDNGKIAGAALDVVDGEPHIWEPLREYAAHQKNLILTPHICGNTAESRLKCQIYIANKIKDYIERSG